MAYADTLRTGRPTMLDVADSIDGVFGTSYVVTFGTWSPTISATGSMTTGSTSIARGEYLRVGKMIWFWLDFTTTTAGTASDAVLFTLPGGASFSASSSANCIVGSGYLFNGTDDVGCHASKHNDTTARIIKYDGSNYSLNANTFHVCGMIKIA